MKDILGYSSQTEAGAIRKSEAQLIFDQAVISSQSAFLGNEVLKTDIKSTIGPFHVLPDYKTQYPPSVVRALGKLYEEYNQAFRPLVQANKEWDSDYQFCMADDGTPRNGWVQIDMVGLPEQFLKSAVNMSEDEISEVLRRNIFEIENSLAMYQLLEQLHSDGNHDTLFKQQFRSSLDEVRKNHQKPIALLAVTEPKYDAMRQSEFGKTDGEQLTDEEVKQLSGFDAFLGPEQFLQHLQENGGQCGYLLYVRSSDPVAKLKDPGVQIAHPLLDNNVIRKTIKANAITFNIDSPSMLPERRINDTKEYLPLMRMGYPIQNYEEIESPKFLEYLKSNGIEWSDITSGNRLLRVKPIKGTYGCYGHLRGNLGDKKFRNEFRQNLRKRGTYVVQPEMNISLITNSSNGIKYTFIDRNFLSFVGDQPIFMGGFRSLIPANSFEAQQGRNHGNGSTVWAEIW